jgi:hypothetical protein
LLFQQLDLLSNLVEFLVVSLVMQDPLLEEGEKDQTNDHIEKKHQEQLKLPVRCAAQERPKSLWFHDSTRDG